jgi:hypothetical protein
VRARRSLRRRRSKRDRPLARHGRHGGEQSFGKTAQEGGRGEEASRRLRHAEVLDHQGQNRGVDEAANTDSRGERDEAPKASTRGRGVSGFGAEQGVGIRVGTTRDLRRRTPPFSCRKLKRRWGVGCRLLAAMEHYIVVHVSVSAQSIVASGLPRRCGLRRNRRRPGKAAVQLD